MRALAACLFILSVSLPAGAGEPNAVDAWLRSLPPMSPEARAAFDKAARSMYRPECNCLTWIDKSDGRVWRARLPLSDDDRRILIESLNRNLIVPLGPGGNPS